MVISTFGLLYTVLMMTMISRDRTKENNQALMELLKHFSIDTTKIFKHDSPAGGNTPNPTTETFRMDSDVLSSMKPSDMSPGHAIDHDQNDLNYDYSDFYKRRQLRRDRHQPNAKNPTVTSVYDSSGDVDIGGVSKHSSDDSVFCNKNGICMTINEPIMSFNTSGSDKTSSGRCGLSIICKRNK